MKSETKKALGASVAGAGVGFVAGLLLHRPKAANQIVLSNLIINPSMGTRGTVVTISVTAKNNGPATWAAVVAMFGNNQLEIGESFAAGESKTLTWTATDDGSISGMQGIYAVAVSVNPLLGTYQEVVPI